MGVFIACMIQWEYDTIEFRDRISFIEFIQICHYLFAICYQSVSLLMPWSVEKVMNSYWKLFNKENAYGSNRNYKATALGGKPISLNSMEPSDAIQYQTAESPLLRVMACSFPGGNKPVIEAHVFENTCKISAITCLIAGGWGVFKATYTVWDSVRVIVTLFTFPNVKQRHARFQCR